MRSGFERTIAKLLKTFKVKFKYESEKIPYTYEAFYIPDFKVGDVYIEAKGLFTAPDRRKLLAVKKANPDLDLRIWFMRDNFLTKAKSSRYSDWALRHGFPFHVGDSFPRFWFNSKKSK